MKTPTGLRFSGYSAEYTDMLANLGIEMRDPFWPIVAGDETLAGMASRGQVTAKKKSNIHYQLSHPVSSNSLDL